jgi:hypothetical protein
MPQLQYPSFIPSSIPNEDINSNSDSSMKSDLSSVEWLGPENQLGLEPDDQAGVLDKGKIKHHETKL